jgi:hypothetical protein
MTEDIETGLALLAREAVPARVDPDEVMARARERSRRRRATMATAFASVVAVCAVAVALHASGPSADEQLAEQLTEQLRAAAPQVIPDDWEPTLVLRADEPLPGTFRCTRSPRGVEMCHAQAIYHDSAGRLKLQITVTDDGGQLVPCISMYCEFQKLPDGTDVQVDEGTAMNYIASGGVVSMLALRPNGTTVVVTTAWTEKRESAPLSVAEFTRFATVFSV